ncbi:MAG: homoserine kinase [Polaromonas sp.]|jgi:homoserine kinase type II|nr:homoserine kinase [Polaromonas sp.]MBK7026884.1 homoserine kinase [Polaromonas sp.]MBP6088337.1 homoserine kinase [Polaromonas sp.]MBP6155371.1 homoserine kinase [Polaromonas sp.]MBP7115316.1 homoserine kinase [Polaromonas sp.]
MAVYTEITPTEAQDLLHRLDLGNVTSLEGCAGGIENTNYFVTTDKNDYVLTVFERLSFEQLPYYLHLMQHLAKQGIPVPDPAPDATGALLHSLHGKPACVVNKLLGKSELVPQISHCQQVGEMLARMHLAGKDYAREQPNLRSLPWWNETVPVILPHLDAAQKALLLSELAYQNHVFASSAYAALPCGPVHADLFRDNVMFDAGKLTGFFDFYFAGNDKWLFDLAVALNDWCLNADQSGVNGLFNEQNARHFIAAYEKVRPLNAAERQLLPAMLRAAALRFWISRLWDFHLPREASVLKAHDPTHFERVLRQRVNAPLRIMAT